MATNLMNVLARIRRRHISRRIKQIPFCLPKKIWTRRTIERKRLILFISILFMTCCFSTRFRKKNFQSTRKLLENNSISPITYNESRQNLKPLSPVVLSFEVCNGLTNQRIALLDGISIGIALGAQLILPQKVPFNGLELPGKRIERHWKPFQEIFNREKLEEDIRNAYRTYWCSQESQPAKDFFCGRNLMEETTYDPIIEESSGKDIVNSFEILQALRKNVKVLKLQSRGLRDFDYFRNLGKEIYHSWKKGGKRDRVLVDGGCTLFSMSVHEGTPGWQVFWQLSDALRFSRDIEDTSALLMKRMNDFHEVARKRALRKGYHSTRNGVNIGFNVLHIRSEKDWIIHCSNWMGLQDGIHRDNCGNNTLRIYNVLLSEGVDPSIPLYITTGSSKKELLSLQWPGSSEIGLLPLMETYTVVTKDMIFEDLGNRWAKEAREKWAAIDFIMAQKSLEFIGNSVSTFSAFILVDRQRKERRGFHYNGGNVPLQDDGVLSPIRSLAVQTLRRPIKWVFAIHEGQTKLSNSFVNMVKVAVLSAKLRTSLIPICITTKSPTSELSVWLVKHGVRVIHHTPAWIPLVEKKVNPTFETKHVNAKSHLSKDVGAMVGTFLRIDIPIIGILDEFVLYTDVDVLFLKDISWETLFESKKLVSKISQRSDFAHGRLSTQKSGQLGLPLYYSATSEVLITRDPREFNVGVMLLNMRSLRDTYDNFVSFIFSNEELNWPEGPGDQGAYKNFYQLNSGFLPHILNWKSYWSPNDDAVILHFHGAKCEQDIIPYRRTGTVNRELFRFILLKCSHTGDCNRRCDEYDYFLSLAETEGGRESPLKN